MIRACHPGRRCRVAGARAGHILLADLTIFTTLFGGAESLDNFWYNLATKG